MNKLYLLSCFLLLTGARLSAQEAATTPIVRKSQRIVLHFKDTTGLFTRLANILINRGHDIEMKDREFGILRTKSSPIPGGYSYTQQMEVKSVFRDSTITLSSVIHWGESHYEVVYTKNYNPAWNELMKICEFLKPDSISYLSVRKFTAEPTSEIPKGGRF